MLTLSDHNAYPVGLKEDIVSKQKTRFSYTYCTHIYIYIYERKTQQLLCPFVFVYYFIQ